ncbi:VOC family protein [Rhodohalobacter sp. SW132]|uniref:VOC family protein n=1 Tax=Rhodohalobacter sp. SW132 TaxID=2293433 RepID=UPI000E2745E3|nr:VOC family protein [Rhodohalobacter sp. SW132]REL24014.1 VOC family protein [Rhodohalobacter sp. SW132]
MLTYNHTFSSFSVDELPKAWKFYQETLGLGVEESGDMGLSIRLKDNHRVFIYPKAEHQPATFTVLNFVVNDIDEVMKSMKQHGVQFEHYQNEHLPQDEQGVLRGLQENMGPDIAWFKDPAGNVLAIVQEK